MTLKTDGAIYQLVEINRALRQDLDIIRRSVSVLGRERDELLIEVEGLRKRAVQNNSRDSLAKMKKDLVDIRKELEEGRNSIYRFRENIECQLSLICRYYTDDQRKREELFDEVKHVLFTMKNAISRLVGLNIEAERSKESLQ